MIHDCKEYSVNLSCEELRNIVLFAINSLIDDMENDDLPQKISIEQWVDNFINSRSWST